MYTRNFALSRYNHPSLPAGCELDPEALRAPAHMRVLFQALGSVSGRARAVASADDEFQLPNGGAGDAPSCRFVAALSSESTYAEAVAHAKGTAWTRKVHRQGVLDSKLIDLYQKEILGLIQVVVDAEPGLPLECSSSSF